MTGNKVEQVSEAELHAYADGQLDAARRAVVDRYLEANPVRATEVAEWKRQNDAVRALYGHVADEAVPERLSPRRQAVQARRSPAWMSLAASLAILAAGAGLGWFGREMTAPDTQVVAAALVDQAIAAHEIYAVEVNHPVEVSASEESHLVGWLSKRLGHRISAPDLGSHGFHLVGGRLLPGTEGPAAQFMYENDEGRRITLYATRAPSQQLAAFQFKSEKDVQSFYWQDRDLSYAIVGNIDRDALKGLALQVYQQLG